MNKYYYDLHIHSCLSPCGDDASTPSDIVGMGVLNGLNVMALTDHNTTKNCPAFFKCAKAMGIVAIAGMELTTAEEIHVVCLFEHLDDAVKFGDEVDRHRIRIKNRTDIFGNQLIMNEDDEIIGTDDFLLSNATDISVESVKPLVERFGGICYPAHVDRDSNGIIAILGDFPADYGFSCAEFHDKGNVDEYSERFPSLRSLTHVVSSDAHYLWNIKEADRQASGDTICTPDYFLIDDSEYSSDKVRAEIFKILRNETK